MVIVNFDKQTIEEIDRRQARQNQGEKKKERKQEIRRTLFKSKIWKKKRHSIDLYLFLNLED